MLKFICDSLRWIFAFCDCIVCKVERQRLLPCRRCQSSEWSSHLPLFQGFQLPRDRGRRQRGTNWRKSVASEDPQERNHVEKNVLNTMQRKASIIHKCKNNELNANHSSDRMFFDRIFLRNLFTVTKTNNDTCINCMLTISH